MKLKGKKIAFFNALPHHGRFLFPVAEAAEREGAEILFFTTLVDYPYELDVMKRHFKCKFLVEYINDETKEKVSRVHNSLLSEWMKINFTWHGFRHWSLFQQHRSLTRNVEDYFCLEQLILKEKPDLFITLHEMNPWGKQIGHLTKKYDIPFITLQEGDYYNPMINFTTHTEYSLINLLWGNHTRNTLIGHNCSFYKLAIIGNTHIDEAVKTYTTPTYVRKIKEELSIPKGKKVVSFLLNIFWGATAEKAVWESLISGLKDKDIFCIFKWHPQVTYVAFEEIKKIILSIMPDASVLFSYDPYKVLAVSDYCVVMGKTTLGVEALAFGKPLFDLYNIVDGEEYYRNLGVAQPVSPAGNWEALFNTMKSGVPEEIKETAQKYVENVFYRLDGKSTHRALQVVKYIFDVRKDRDVNTWKYVAFQHQLVSGKVSFVLPSGQDLFPLLATVKSIAENTAFTDYEIIIAANSAEIKRNIENSFEGLKTVFLESNNVAALYNAGAAVSEGEFLVFLLPGVLYLKDGSVVDCIKRAGIAGFPLYNSDLTPYNLGTGIDFNFTPYPITKPGGKVLFISSMLFGISKEALEAIGGFDDNIAYFIIDACLRAKEQGFPSEYMADSMGIVIKPPSFITLADFRFDAGQWKSPLKFFAKWYRKLDKNDDYMEYAKEMLNT
ncbi:MAG: hypothetical protein HQK88_14270 [Nitrospirae bacterium]|nr:hypothetical protein [Nitrospirota bacterium]MBF0536072.1 hypothetical protein [Nitrospirota bacterium]MBF0617967.1 hypothetical protein [Nitrospirota bacterium]